MKHYKKFKNNMPFIIKRLFDFLPIKVKNTFLLSHYPMYKDDEKYNENEN